MRKILPVIFSLFVLSCEVKVSTKTGNDNTRESQNKKIRNGITLKENKLAVDQAFLMFEDGKLVPEDNKVEIGQKVRMRLILDGWVNENGKAFPGASEKITTSSGETMLNADDLFASYTEGLPAEDAKNVVLSATITQVDKLYDYFLVSFRVWDKKGDGEVSGSYKLYLK